MLYLTVLILMIIVQLIEVALDKMVHNDDFSSVGGQDTLIRRIAALHVVYMFNKSQIMWFGQLVSQKPGIMLTLKDKQSPDTSEMVFLSLRLLFYIHLSFVRCSICLLWRRHWMI